MNSLKTPPLSTESPCEGPCSKEAQSCHGDPCSEEPSSTELSGFQSSERASGLARLVNTSFLNALKICFDELPTEPRRILMIGGCRQRDFARYLGFLLPSTDIVVMDFDAEAVQKAKEEVCCRFKFVRSTVETMGFEDNTFDLTMAHHLFDYVEDWEKAMTEIARVTSGYFLFTTPRPLLWSVLSGIPSIKASFQSEGLSSPRPGVTRFELLSILNRYAKIKNQLEPLPWKMYMAALKPIKEHRTILEPNIL